MGMEGVYIYITTGKLIFAVRENLCRAFFSGAAKRYFAVRFTSGAR
jgi:hypothetical protein